MASCFVKRTMSPTRMSNSLASSIGIVICIFELTVVFKLRSSRPSSPMVMSCMGRSYGAGMSRHLECATERGVLASFEQFVRNSLVYFRHYEWKQQSGHCNDCKFSARGHHGLIPHWHVPASVRKSMALSLQCCSLVLQTTS